MESRDSIGLFTGHEALHIGRVESHYTREGRRKNETLLKKEKKKGVIMVNEVPREVPRLIPEVF